MQVDITSRRFDASDNLKNYITDEVKKLPKYFDRITDVKVIIEKPDDKNHILTLHVNVSHSNNTTFVVISTSKSSISFPIFNEGVICLVSHTSLIVVIPSFTSASLQFGHKLLGD